MRGLSRVRSQPAFCLKAPRIEFSCKRELQILCIATNEKPSNITLDGKGLPEAVAWSFDAKDQRLIIKTRDYTEGAYLDSFQ